MTVLVTGATGFIGEYVIRQLLIDGHEVIATSRSEEKASNCIWYKDVVFIAYDIGVPEDGLFDKFRHPDSLIHLAWRGLPNYKQRFHFEEELPLQYQFIKQLVVEGLKDINITGTCFEYGMQQGCLNESTPASPQNPYAVAKDSLREFLSMLQKDFSFTMKWMRLFYMFGKGQNEKSILVQLERALINGDSVFQMSKGEQIRDYLPVNKMASYICAVSMQTSIQGIINISSNHPITILKLVQDYLAAQKKSIDLHLGFYPYPDYEPFAFWGDNQKLQKIIQL